jgi:hypothetical protein
MINREKTMSLGLIVKNLRRTAGYTLDQTILIVAIIAILITLIIISVGWELINRSSGTKLAAQFRQVEDAIGQFYSTYRIWPDESYGVSNPKNADPYKNMLALADDTSIQGSFIAQVTNIGQKNFVPGFESNGTYEQHNFGSGGAVGFLRLDNPFKSLPGTYLVVQFEGVPFSEAQAAEKAVDGSNGIDYANGRIVVTTKTGSKACLVGGSAVTSLPSDATTSGGTTVSVCYAANQVQ